MILDKLFIQYKKKKKLLFGSKWLNLHGRALLGKPKELVDRMQVPVNPQLLKTYYYIPLDRWSPKENVSEEARLEWRKDNICLTALREEERKRCAMAVGALCFALCVGIFASQGVVLKVGEGLEKAKNAVVKSAHEEARTEAIANNEPLTHEQCIDQVIVWIDEDKGTKDLSKNEKAVYEKCMEDYPSLDADVSLKQLEEMQR